MRRVERSRETIYAIYVQDVKTKKLVNAVTLRRLIIGEDELARGVVAMKPLREQSGQSECPIAELAAGVDAALLALAAPPGQPAA